MNDTLARSVTHGAMRFGLYVCICILSQFKTVFLYHFSSADTVHSYWGSLLFA